MLLEALPAQAIFSVVQDPDNWRIVFLICAVVYIFGMLVFLVIGSGEVQPWATPKTVVTPEQVPLSGNSARQNSQAMANDDILVCFSTK